MFFRFVIPLVLFALQFLVYRRMARWARAHHPGRPWLLTLVRVLFIMFNLGTLGVVLFRPQLNDFPAWFLAAGVYPYFIWQAATFFLGLVFLVALIVAAPGKGAMKVLRAFDGSRRVVEKVEARPAVQQFDASRRVFLRRSAEGIALASFAGSAYGMTAGRENLQITEEEYRIPNLPASLDGMTIALASDIHSGPYMPLSDMKEYVGHINALKADVIVVTGDFVNGRVREVHPFSESFSGLSAPMGVYGVMGNHDFYTEDPDDVARRVDDCGVRLLRNDHVMLSKGNGSLALLGVDDIGRSPAGPVNIDAATRGVPAGTPRVLLCHRPYYLAQAAREGIDLVLSGHTHGGQVVLGQFGDIVLAPASLASRFIGGTYSQGSTRMLVSRGIGTVGLPIRLNCPPEITRITLRTGAA